MPSPTTPTGCRASVSRVEGDVESPEQVAELFEVFIGALAAHVDENGWKGFDVHFWPQHLLLGRRPAGRVLTLRAGVARRGAGRRAGASRVPWHHRGAGTTDQRDDRRLPPRPGDRGGDGSSLALYSADFPAWDYLPRLLRRGARPIDFAWLNDVRGRNGRYQVVHEAAMHGETRERELLADVARARTREQELLASTSWRITRPVRAVSDVVRRRRRPRGALRRSPVSTRRSDSVGWSAPFRRRGSVL